MTSDDIRDEFEPPIQGGTNKGLHAMWKKGMARNKDRYESERWRESEMERRRNAPITLPKFKCLEEGK
jgi:hypothetical protein